MTLFGRFFHEQGLSELIAKYTMDVIDGGLALRMVTKEEVVAAIENTIATHSDADEAPWRYIQTPGQSKF